MRDGLLKFNLSNFLIIKPDSARSLLNDTFTYTLITWINNFARSGKKKKTEENTQNCKTMTHFSPVAENPFPYSLLPFPFLLKS